MPEFAILGGLPGSGKSSKAKCLKTERAMFVVSSDALRLALNAGVYPLESTGDYDRLADIVWKLAEQAITSLLRAGHNCAIDATNLTKAERLYWHDLARSVVPEIPVTLWWCTGNWDSAERWARERGVPVEAYNQIRSKLEAKLELPTPDEGLIIRQFPESASPETAKPGA